MKKSLLILFIIICFYNSENLSAKGFILTFTYENNIFSTNPTPLYGINYEVFVNKNLTLNYSAAFGKSNGEWNYHLTGGLTAGGAILSGVILSIDELEFETEEVQEVSGVIIGGGIALSVLAMIVPEGVTYYLPLSRYIKTGFYCNPLGFRKQGEGLALSSSLGIKFQYNLNDKWILVPNIGYNYYWGELPGHVNIGLSLGFAIDVKEKVQEPESENWDGIMEY